MQTLPFNPNLEPIRSLATAEVFEIWRDTEEGLAHWNEVWRSKGFKYWEEWRRSTHEPILTANLSWTLYRVLVPLVEIPYWSGGMFHAWDKWFYGAFEDDWHPV